MPVSERAAPPFPKIHLPPITEICLAYGATAFLSCFWPRNKMHLVGHQALCPCDTLENGWHIVDLTDDRGRRFHVELIEPITEADYARDWRDWQKYKAANAGTFVRIDAELLREHL